MKDSRVAASGKPANVTTPVEIEPTDEFQPAYGRGGPVRSDEPERDFFFEDGAAAASDKTQPGAVSPPKAGEPPKETAKES
jgi:hypothetical protein